MKKTRVRAIIGLVSAATIVLSGCASNEPESTATDSSPSEEAPATDNAPEAEADAVGDGVNSDAVALLPDAIKESGKLTIGIDPTYPPNEYRDSDGNMTGWNVDLFDAVAARMGLEADFQNATFDNILPSVKAGRYDVGVSSFTDNAKREEQVDFVTYFTAGSQWAALKGSTVTPEDPCGLTVAVGVGTEQALSELPAMSDKCVEDGKEAIDLLTYPTQDLTTQSVVLGKADAMNADSPVSGYAVQKTDDKLQLVGPVLEAAPYGVMMSKDAGTLKEALQKAIQSMIDDGTYTEILSTWGVESGGIETSQINAASGN